MSQASKQIDWCLKKAKKELEKSKLHRGLVKTAKDITLAEKHITKAEEMHESNIVKIRENFQYGVELDFKEKEEFNKLVEICKEDINKTRDIVHK